MVTSQLKILTTALFTVLILRRHLSVPQWAAVVVLTSGVAIVQWDVKEQDAASKMKANATKVLTTLATTVASAKREHNIFLGVFAVSVNCLLSGFAGIYFEKILKGRTEVSVWIRNVQLALPSVPLTLLMAFVNDGGTIMSKGFMFGFDEYAWGNVMLASLGGLIVAVVIKFADNILKTFATSVAIIVGSVASIYYFQFSPSLKYVGGTAMVIGALFVYGLYPYKKPGSTAPAAAKETEKQEAPSVHVVPSAAPPAPASEETTDDVKPLDAPAPSPLPPAPVVAKEPEPEAPMKPPEEDQPAAAKEPEPETLMKPPEEDQPAAAKEPKPESPIKPLEEDHPAAAKEPEPEASLKLPEEDEGPEIIVDDVAAPLTDRAPVDEREEEHKEDDF